MSSFRVERQCVAFKPRQDNVPNYNPITSADEKETLRRKMQLVQLEEQTEKSRAEAQQIRTEAQKECARLKEEAGRAAAQLLDQAKKEAQALQKAEKERGFLEGQKASEKEKQKWKAGEQEKFDTQVQQMQAMYKSKIDEIQKDVTTLVAEITEKIIGIKMSESDQTFLNVVEAAMSRFRQNDDLVVHLSSEDFRHFSETGSISALSKTRGRNLFLHKDPSMKKGGCVLESDAEFVDCGVSGQLDRMKEVLASEKGDDFYDEQTAKVQGSLAKK